MLPSSIMVRRRLQATRLVQHPGRQPLHRVNVVAAVGIQYMQCCLQPIVSYIHAHIITYIYNSISEGRQFAREVLGTGKLDADGSGQLSRQECEAQTCGGTSCLAPRLLSIVLRLEPGLHSAGNL